MAEKFSSNLAFTQEGLKKMLDSLDRLAGDLVLFSTTIPVDSATLAEVERHQIEVCEKVYRIMAGSIAAARSNAERLQMALATLEAEEVELVGPDKKLLT
jgi:hypothetical protein